MLECEFKSFKIKSQMNLRHKSLNINIIKKKYICVPILKIMMFQFFFSPNNLGDIKCSKLLVV